MFWKSDLKSGFSQCALIPKDDLTAHTSAAACGGLGTLCISPCGNPSRYTVSEKCIRVLSLPCSVQGVGVPAIKGITNETEKPFSFALLRSDLVLALGEHSVCDLHV